jgi:hypothetical protein
LVETQELLASNQLTIAEQVPNLICKSWKYINIILRLYQLVNEMQYFMYLKLPLNKRTYMHMPKKKKLNLNAY